MTRLRLLAVLPVTALLSVAVAYERGFLWPILGVVRSVCRRNPEYEPDVVG